MATKAVPANLHVRYIENADDARDGKIFKKIAVILADDNVRRLLIRMVIVKMLRTTDTMRNILKQHERYKVIDEGYRAIFEWSMSHFKQRVQIQTSVGIDLLLSEEHPKTLSLAKTVIDLNNVHDVLKMLYDEKTAYASTTLKGCQKLLNIRVHLERQHVANSRILRHVQTECNNFDAYGQHVMHEMDVKFNKARDEGRDQELVVDPISTRYERDYDANCWNMELHTLQQLEDALAQAKVTAEITFKRNEAVSHTTWQLYMINIDDMRQQLSHWEAKYEEDYEKVSNTLAYKQRTLESIAKRWAECLEHRTFFRQYVRDQKEQERLRLVRAVEARAEAAALEELLAASKHSSKRGKRKK